MALRLIRDRIVVGAAAAALGEVLCASQSRQRFAKVLRNFATFGAATAMQ